MKVGIVVVGGGRGSGGRHHPPPCSELRGWLDFPKRKSTARHRPNFKKLEAVTFETLGFPQILKENKFEANSRQIRDLAGVDIESRIVGFPIQMKAKPRFEGNSRNQIRDKFEGHSRPTFQRKISVAARNVPKHSEV